MKTILCDRHTNERKCFGLLWRTKQNTFRGRLNVTSKGDIFSSKKCKILKSTSVEHASDHFIYFISPLLFKMHHIMIHTTSWFTSQHCYTMQYNYDQSTRLTRLENGCNNQLFFIPFDGCQIFPYFQLDTDDVYGILHFSRPRVIV